MDSGKLLDKFKDLTTSGIHCITIWDKGRKLFIGDERANMKLISLENGQILKDFGNISSCTRQGKIFGSPKFLSENS